MTAQHDPGRRLAEHLRIEAPTRAPDWLLESTLAIIETTPQRRGLLRLPWRIPIVNTFAKLAITAVAVVVGAVAVTTFAGSRLPGIGGPGPVVVTPSPSPSPSASPSPTPSPSPAATAATIGSLTLTTTGCQWVGETTGLPAGPVQLEASNTTPDDGSFALYVLAPGHAYQELATVLDQLNTRAHQNPSQLQIQVPTDIASPDGLIGLLAPGATKSLTTDIPAGSVVGIACTHGDAAADAVFDVYAVGPLAFR
jgi:hypothetical protein